MFALRYLQLLQYNYLLLPYKISDAQYVSISQVHQSTTVSENVLALTENCECVKVLRACASPTQVLLLLLCVSLIEIAYLSLNIPNLRLL